MGSFVRRVRTASGATAVQIVHKRGRTVLGIDHIGSAHDEGQLAMLLETARARLHAGQQMLPIDDGPTGGRPIGEPLVEGTASLPPATATGCCSRRRPTGSPASPTRTAWAGCHKSWSSCAATG